MDKTKQIEKDSAVCTFSSADSDYDKSAVPEKQPPQPEIVPQIPGRREL